MFQIAAHTDVVPLETLYAWCEGARELLTGDYAVARVIARPFTGTPGNFRRLGEARRDYSLTPPHETVLDVLKAAGKEVVGVGKIPDIYDHRGFTEEIHTDSNEDGVDKTLVAMRKDPDGLVFCNLVEFDSLYGHRRDPHGYADALRATDTRLPELLAAVRPGDWLLFVSDHGNDPTHGGYRPHPRVRAAAGLQPRCSSARPRYESEFRRCGRDGSRSARGYLEGCGLELRPLATRIKERARSTARANPSAAKRRTLLGVTALTSSHACTSVSTCSCPSVTRRVSNASGVRA